MGGLWQCVGCGEWFCMVHSHVTELGNNKECAACERQRIDDKQLEADDGIEKIAARADPGDRLDIPDKA